MPTVIVGGCCSRSCNRCISGVKKHWRLLIALVLGQFLSLMLCGTGVTSALLENHYSISVPTSQAFINYIMLGLIFGVWLAFSRKNFPTILKENWWKYAILGIMDVEANYLVILAYKYTTLTSIQLLDSFTIACVMVLSFLFLKTRYKVINFMGVVLALIGIVTVVLADLERSRLSGASDQLKGDLLCLGGVALYSISNVAQEFLVKNHSITEYLGLLGVSGSVVSGVQLLILERPALTHIDWNMDILLLFLEFGVCMFLFYSVMTMVMRFSSAVVVNLSLLTADVYTVLFGLFLFHYKFSLFYLLAFALVICGVFIFNLKPPSMAQPKQKKSADLQDKSHRKKENELSSREGGGLLETQSVEMSSNRRTCSPSYGSIEEQSSNPAKSSQP